MKTNEKGRKAEEKREKREDKIKKLPLLCPRDVWTGVSRNEDSRH